MADTRTALLQEATALVRGRGYSSFSYADLAAAVGIRKASIHHHFPTKADLGEEIVDGYARRFAARLARIRASGAEAVDQLQQYAALYRDGLRAGQACLCGMLASETELLPEQVQRRVSAFFEANLAWLTEVIDEGIVDGTLRARLDPATSARTYLSALQGAMFVAKSLHDPGVFDDAGAGALAGLLS